jgi:type II secretory pathway pseudopilin PulG
MRSKASSAELRIHSTGFSLLELLLVLGLLTVFLVIAVPSLRRWQQRLPIERSVALLQQQIAETRLASIQSGETWALWMYSSGTEGRRTPLNQPDLDKFQFQFPEGICCRSDEDAESQDTQDLLLIFRPDGSSSTARLMLADSQGNQLLVVLDRLTGAASIQPSGSS